jgi:transcriptional regulator with PAS, ATPase and Fis domain
VPSRNTLDHGNTAVTLVTQAGEPVDARAGHFQLVVIGDGAVATYALPEHAEVTIGRGHACDIRIDDESISRRHAVLQIGGKLTIEDLGSANGTQVRGHKLKLGHPATISAGELVGIGNLSILLQHRPRAVTHPGSAAGSTPGDADIVVTDPQMKSLHDLVRQVAGSKIGVLLLGETGVGKEVFARAVHRSSPRAAGPFVEINCAAVTETLLESELFGHEKGAFTNAIAGKQGLIELAHGGTLFLDEIGDMPQATQAKLLRVIEDAQLRRVGGLKTRAIDVRFVAATNSDLETQMASGAFRRDLYFRLNGVTIEIPPLRERLGELEALANRFIVRTCQRDGTPPPALTPEALELMRRYRWPGNVRELKNMIERAVLLSGGGPIRAEHLSGEKLRAPTGTPAPPALQVVEAAERALLRGRGTSDERQSIVEALERAGGNQTVAARLLGMSRRTLVNRLDEYDLARPRKHKASKPPGD